MIVSKNFGTGEEKQSKCEKLSMMADEIILIARKALADEIFAASTYKLLAAKYGNTSTGEAFAKAAVMEDEHISFWSDFLRQRGIDTSSIKLNKMRFFLQKSLLRIIGKGLTLRIMESDENAAIELYSSVLEKGGLKAEERERIIKFIGDELVHENMVTDEETRLGNLTAYIKDAVLGMSDGLVEILSVTTGLAGATGSPLAVAISGLVVGIAGAISMGISTYSSSRSQRQIHEGMIGRIVSASKFVAHIFKERIQTYFEKRGYSRNLSAAVAEETGKDTHLLSSTIAEQEYGIRQENLGNPLYAALYAGVTNLIAAFIPLLPYFFMPNILTALIMSVILATLALAMCGCLVAVLAYMPPGKKITEMILIGWVAALVTYGIGRAASVFLGMEV